MQPIQGGVHKTWYDVGAVTAVVRKIEVQENSNQNAIMHKKAW